MADKNHATVIHATKMVGMFLEMRDALTIQIMDEWVKVFNSTFGGSKSKIVMFEEHLDNIINLSGLSNETVKNLLIEKTESIEV